MTKMDSHFHGNDRKDKKGEEKKSNISLSQTEKFWGWWLTPAPAKYFSPYRIEL